MFPQPLRLALMTLVAMVLSLLGTADGQDNPGFRPLQPLPTRTPAPSVERIGYESLRCRGFCPVMSVTFAADGTFHYVGELNVERLGEFTGRVDAFALEQVMRYVEAIDFRNLAETYPSTYADVQTTYLTVDWGEEVQVLENQGNSAPVTVWALERLLLDLLDDAIWD